DAGRPHPCNSARDAALLKDIAGLSFVQDGRVVHNSERRLSSPNDSPPLPYELLGDPRRYLRPSFFGERTAVHQISNGCRYHCSFCGVVSMFNGKTVSEAPAKLEKTLTYLKDQLGATAMQYYDNNFFDREQTSIETLEVLARFKMPYWCFARTDTLANF